MHMLFACLVIALIPFPTFATDTGAIAAALKDEEAECRYLRQLCTEAKETFLSKTMSVKAKTDKIGEAFAAAQVIRAKHERMPACFEVCEGILNVERLR